MLVKNLDKDDFKYLIQEFDNNLLDIVKQKGLYPYEYLKDSEKFKEESLRYPCFEILETKVI